MALIGRLGLALAIGLVAAIAWAPPAASQDPSGAEIADLIDELRDPDDHIRAVARRELVLLGAAPADALAAAVRGSDWKLRREALDVLEDIGLIRHAHGLDGREEFHVRPAREHGHLHCSLCHRAWEIGRDEVADLAGDLEVARGFRMDLGHLSVVGVCRDCQEESEG